MNHLAIIHKQKPSLTILSLTVDPKNDTPQRLLEYGKDLHVDGPWMLLTDEPTKIKTLIEKEFRSPFGQAVPTSNGGYDIMHSGKVLVFDRNGVLRAYFESQDIAAITQAVEDLN